MTTLREGILRRARRRKSQGGAAIFIVAVTLALLASMGVYGLTSAASDVTAAGYLRQNTQAQHGDNGIAMAGAEAINPTNARQIVLDMVDPSHRSNTSGTPCKSALPPSSNLANQTAEACLRLSESQMRILAGGAWTGSVFQSGALGIPQDPYFRVELTNPVEVPGPAGNTIDGQVGSQMYFAQITATVYLDLKTSASAATDATMLGRGRFTIGPYRR